MVLGTVSGLIRAALPGVLGGLLLIHSACSRSCHSESVATVDRPPVSAAPAAAHSKSDVASERLDQVQVNGLAFELRAKDSSCALRVQNTELPLALTAPCFFLRRAEKVQNFSYPDVQLDMVLIVAGNPVPDAMRQRWNLRPGDVCGDHAQAVLGSGTDFRVSQAVHKDGLFCRDQGVDEKEFWSFAHPPQ